MHGMQEVTGSIPVISTNLKASHRNVWCFCFLEPSPPALLLPPKGGGFSSAMKSAIMPRAPPLGELSPKVTERARMLVPIAVTRRFCQKGADPLRHGLRRATSPEGTGFSGDCQLYRTVKKLSPRESCRANARLRGSLWRIAASAGDRPSPSRLTPCPPFQGELLAKRGAVLQ